MASWRKLWNAVNSVLGEFRQFLNKGDQENGIFEFYTEKSLSLDRHGQSWDLAQQNGMGWLCLVSCF